MGTYCYVYILSIINVWLYMYQVNGQQLQSGQRYLKECVMIPAEFGNSYTSNINQERELIYEYDYQLTNQTTAVRVTVSVPNVTEIMENNPIQFVVRQKHSIISWKVPFVLEQNFIYNMVSRNPCPFNVLIRDSASEIDNMTVFVDVSTFSKVNLSFAVLVDIVEDFHLGTDEIRNVTFTPAGPQYFMYTFPDDVEYVIVHAKSDSDTCMIFSVQDIRCPVYDLDRNVEFSGIYQTMTKQASITVQKSAFDHKAFYMVMVLNPSDVDCNGKNTIQDPNYPREKQITLKVYGYSGRNYSSPIGFAVAIFLIFYLVAGVLGYVQFARCSECACCSSCLDALRECCRCSGCDCCSKCRDDISKFRSDEQDQEPTEGVSNFCRNLLNIGIFYGLPVIQLVFIYQRDLQSSGNQDICYYNFDCSRPLGELTSFNNVFSNIGYVMLGILFLLVVWIRGVIRRNRNNADQTPPENHSTDLLYAMGLGLCLEGVMSGCYHVCPSHSNFQFDTSLMYMIACLCVLRIFRCIYPEFYFKAHNSYLFMAFVVCFALLGVLFNTTAVWIIFAFLYSFTAICFHVYVFYGKNSQGRDFGKICNSQSKCRLGVLLFAVLGNVLVAIVGAGTQPTGFALFLLIIFIANLLLYFGIYAFMKILLGGNSCMRTILFILFGTLALSFWIPALWFFKAGLTAWEKTPAQSREGNRNCILLDFYDAHDVWHFLSAIALFMSYLALLVMDELPFSRSSDTELENR